MIGVAAPCKYSIPYSKEDAPHYHTAVIPRGDPVDQAAQEVVAVYIEHNGVTGTLQRALTPASSQSVQEPQTT